MKVLWFSITPSCYDVKNTGSWIQALEEIFRKYLPEVELGIAFEHSDNVFKVERNGVTYYPVNTPKSNSPLKHFEEIRPKYLNVINDFKPDIVHCFGTERHHYGLLAKDVKVPFVIHMMGFMNIYDAMEDMALHSLDYWKYFSFNPLKVYLNHKATKRTKAENQMLEKQVMECNRYFMGRTEWDKNIVKYYSHDAEYFHCPEAIRPEIYNALVRWNFKKDSKIRLVTIGNSGSLKGNDVMLKAAWLLKNEFHVDFEWIYTSDPYKMGFFEKVVGIKHADVNIKLIGRIDAKRIAEELSKAELYIHPSIIDNSPNTLCEAQLVGIPVIAANTGGLAQMVEDGKTGVLYPFNEAHALAFAIMNLHNDEERLCTMSDAEYKMSHMRHNPELIAKRVMEIYDEIADINKK